MKDHEPVREDGRIRFLLTGRQLEISVAVESDIGKYSCIAINIAGKDKKDFDLKVLGKSNVYFLFK